MPLGESIKRLGFHVSSCLKRSLPTAMLEVLGMAVTRTPWSKRFFDTPAATIVRELSRRHPHGSNLDGHDRSPLRTAGRVWPSDGSSPLRRPIHGRVAVVLLPGADAEVILPLIEWSADVYLFTDERSRGAEEFAIEHPRTEIVPRPNRQGTEDRPWIAELRGLASTICDRLAAETDDEALASTLPRHRTLITNALARDLIRDVEQIEDALDALASRNWDAVIVAEGDLPSDPLVATLGERFGSGVGVVCASWSPLRRREFVARRLPDAAPTGNDGFALYLADVTRRCRLPDLAGRAVVCADFRHPLDFRYLPSARSILSAAAGRRSVCLLQSYNRLSLRLIAVTLEAWRLTRRIAGIVFVPSHHALRRRNRPLAWVDRIGEIARATAATAEAPMIADAAVAVATSTRQCAALHLASSLALAAALEGGFRAKPPAYVILVPDTQPFTMAVASAARAAGVPALAVQTLMIGQSERDARPTADWVGSVDTVQRGLYVERFGLGDDHVVTLGSLDVDDWRETARSRPVTPPPSRRRVIFVSQPFPEMCERALNWLAEAVASRSDLELRIHLHPGEGESVRTAFAGILARVGAQDRMSIAGVGTSIEDVLAADVVANVVSNVGFRAGVVGARVLVLDPTESGLPVRFHEMGLAVAARDAAETARLVDDLVDGRLDADLQRTRSAFLSANPQLTEGRLGDRTIDFAERVLAGATADRRTERG